MAETAFPEIVVALLTPFDDDGRIDGVALRGHVRFLAAAGVDAVLVAGTTGEGPLLEDDEVIDAVVCALEASEGRVSVMANVGRPSTRATLRLAGRAVEAGADALAAVTPYYYAPSDDQLLAHYRELLAAVAVDVLAYNIPSRTQTDLAPSLVRALAADGLDGLKDSTKSLERHLEYLAVAREVAGFRVYMGSDGLAHESLERGSAGCISAIANVRPDLLLGLREACIEGSEPGPMRDGIRRMRAELAEQGSIVGLKRELAKTLSGHAVAYPPHARPPLAPAGRLSMRRGELASAERRSTG